MSFSSPYEHEVTAEAASAIWLVPSCWCGAVQCEHRNEAVSVGTESATLSSDPPAQGDRVPGGQPDGGRLALPRLPPLLRARRDRVPEVPMTVIGVILILSGILQSPTSCGAPWRDYLFALLLVLVGAALMVVARLS